MRLKSGVQEIQYLIEKVVKKYEENHSPLKSRYNAENYQDLAEILSEISNQLPYTHLTLQHKKYDQKLVAQRKSPTSQTSARTYDISGWQLMDARRGKVPNPKDFLVDSCYIYVYNIGRKGFAENPSDPNLIDPDPVEKVVQISPDSLPQKISTNTTGYFIIISALMIVVFILAIGWYHSSRNWNQIKTDMAITPYSFSQQEADSLEGIWLCYTGSPQARPSEPNRYHLVVNNLVEIKPKKNYFTYTRFGASFDHIGYVQFEAPWLVSIYSRVKTSDDHILFPRHSLMKLDDSIPIHSAISASWNFDAAKKNEMIGIREIYVKQGKGGQLQEIYNDVETAACKCKIIRWNKENNEIVEFRLKNQLLDTLQPENIKPLIDENSILLNHPRPDLILKDSAMRVYAH